MSETKSRREIIEASFDNVVNETEEPALEAKNEEIETEQEETESTEPEYQTKEPSREEEEEHSTEPSYSAPQSFTGQEREIFAKLPPEAKQALIRLEKEQHKYFQKRSREYQDRIRSVGDIETVLDAGLNRTLAEAGVTPGQYFTSLVQADKMMRSDPVSSIIRVMKANGVSIEDLTGETPQESGKRSAPVPEIEELRTQIQGMQNYFTQSRVNLVADQIKEFGEETDRNGNRIRPDFENLMQDNKFVQIIRMIQAEKPQAPLRSVLSEAYEWARYANPEIRKSLTKASTANPRAIAQTAKARAGVVGSASATPQSPTYKSRRELIEAVVDKYGI